METLLFSGHIFTHSNMTELSDGFFLLCIKTTSNVLFLSHTADDKWFVSEVGSNSIKQLELSIIFTPALSLADFVLLYKVQAALHHFPDICSMFPFCVAARGSGMEKALPRPLRPHGKGGEQSVRSPPATVGHICGQLSPRCRLRLCVARPASALCCSLSRPRCVLWPPMCRNPKTGHKKNKRRCTFSSIINPPPPSPLPPHVLPLPNYLYQWRSHMKRDHPFAGMRGKDLASSAKWFTAACHTLARMNDFHPLARSYSDTQRENRGKGSANTHMRICTLYILQIEKRQTHMLRRSTPD